MPFRTATTTSGAGLTKVEDVEVHLDGYPRHRSRYWRAVVVNGTESTGILRDERTI